MTVETWKDISGFEGIYQVSNRGNVRRNGRIKSQAIDHGGYCTVSLSVQSKQRTMSVHRIVATAFIPNPDGKRTVNHKDGNKLNNSVENLEWATHSENIVHANKTGLRCVTDAQRHAASMNGKKTCSQNRMKNLCFA